MTRATVGQRFFMIERDLERPRRCGRIAGCRASQPTPGHGRPAIRSRPQRPATPAAVKSPWRLLLVQPALVAEPYHLVDEDLLLLVVERRKQRFGGICDVALIEGAVVEELGFVAHLLDDVVGRI